MCGYVGRCHYVCHCLLLAVVFVLACCEALCHCLLSVVVFCACLVRCVVFVFGVAVVYVNVSCLLSCRATGGMRRGYIWCVFDVVAVVVVAAAVGVVVVVIVIASCLLLVLPLRVVCVIASYLS